MDISIESRGSFDRTERWLRKLQKMEVRAKLNEAGRAGVAALRANTPVESGATAASWDYKLEATTTSLTITWYNTHMAGDVSVAVLLQYGHGTGTGGYVAGRDYINPAMRPIFDKIANDVWKAVTSA